jgi:hypothetical protein
MKTSALILKLIILAGLILSNNLVSSQSKFEISSGLGYPEFINAKIKYGKVFQIGLSQRFFYMDENNALVESVHFLSTSLEIYFHLAGTPKYSDHPLLYLSEGLTRLYGNQNSEWFSSGTSAWLPYFRLGRTIDFCPILADDLHTGYCA